MMARPCLTIDHIPEFKERIIQTVKAVEIIERLFGNKTITSDRVKKAQMLAQRTRLEWASVLAAMTPEQRAGVDNAK